VPQRVTPRKKVEEETDGKLADWFPISFFLHLTWRMALRLVVVTVVHYTEVAFNALKQFA